MASRKNDSASGGASNRPGSIYEWILQGDESDVPLDPLPEVPHDVVQRSIERCARAAPIETRIYIDPADIDLRDYLANDDPGEESVSAGATAPVFQPAVPRWFYAIGAMGVLLLVGLYFLPDILTTQNVSTMLGDALLIAPGPDGRIYYQLSSAYLDGSSAVLVVSDPVEADVVINGRVMGQTPYVWRPEHYDLTSLLIVRKPGYVPDMISIRPGDNRVLRSTLVRVAAGPFP